MDKTTGQAFGMLFQSRAFLLALMDAIVALVAYFVTKYAAPSAAEDVLKVIGILQPVIITVIAKIAVDNRTEAQARTAQAQMQLGLRAPGDE